MPYAPLYTPAYKPNGKEIAVIETNKGTIRVRLHGFDAPIHVGNFVELAKKGFYDGLKFHRYVPNFVIQGGDPMGNGMGGPGYSIKGEWKTNPNNRHKDGTLAMARSSMPDSAGSQFYLCLGPQPFLDRDYTVFGDTIEGLDVVHSLRQGDIMKKISIENAD
ncbi:MAG: peptidylprolyl isomerase [Coriobacteriales bacterium]|nr:peptidylprolyl isomerase [Coriobacteriales bacterium]